MMRISIVTKVGEFSIEVGFKETVLEIKQKIKQLLGVEVATQTLTVYRWELLDGLDLEDYPIVVEGTKIDLTVQPANNKEFSSNEQYCNNNIQISVKILTRRINIEVDRMETVGSLKEKVHILDGAPIKRLMLSFSGIEMEEDYRSLCEYGICNGSEITATHKSLLNHHHVVRADQAAQRRLNVVVQTTSSLLNSARIPLEMKESSSVKEMRQLLLDEHILPVDDYFFVHKQRIMRDEYSLHWHGVKNGDFLYVFKGTVSREY